MEFAAALLEEKKTLDKKREYLQNQLDKKFHDLDETLKVKSSLSVQVDDLRRQVDDLRTSKNRVEEDRLSKYLGCPINL